VASHKDEIEVNIIYFILPHFTFIFILQSCRPDDLTVVHAQWLKLRRSTKESAFLILSMKKFVQGGIPLPDIFKKAFRMQIVEVE
jgi:hypothetical protein